MSETNKSQFKQTLLTVLLLLLFILVSLQAWYMFNIKKQLDVLHKQQASVQLQAQDATAKNMPKKNHTGANNTEDLPEKLPDEPQSSLPEKQNIQPAQLQDKSSPPDTTQPLIHDNPSDTTFGGQTWNPYSEIEDTQQNMDRRINRRFDRFNNRPGVNNSGFNRPDFQYHFSQSISTPEMDVKENTNQYIVLVNLPGANENDISVTLNGQRLTVKGKQDYKKQNKNAMGNITLQVRQSGRFQRSITLSNPVNKNKMKTYLDNGVLTIIIPKARNGQWR